MIYLLATSFLIVTFPFFYKLKLEKFFVLFFLLFIFLLVSLNRHNQDYEAYVHIFNNPEGYAEPGYVFLIKLVKLFNGSHDSILCLLALLTILTFARICNCFKFDGYGYGYFYSFLLFYFIFPLAIDIVQIRNTFSMLLFINSIVFAFESRILLSFIFVLLAPLFHFFGLLYIVIWFVFVLGMYNWRYYKLLYVFFVIASVLMTVLIPKIIYMFDGVRTLSHYISPTVKLHSFAFWGVPLLLDVFVLKFLYKNGVVFKNTYSDFYVRNILNILCIFSLFIPLILYLDEFNRFFRTALIFKYIAFITLAPFLSFNSKAFLFFYIFFISALYGVYYFNALGYDYVLFGSDY